MCVSVRGSTKNESSMRSMGLTRLKNFTLVSSVPESRSKRIFRLADVISIDLSSNMSIWPIAHAAASVES